MVGPMIDKTFFSQVCGCWFMVCVLWFAVCVLRFGVLVFCVLHHDQHHTPLPQLSSNPRTVTDTNWLHYIDKFFILIDRHSPLPAGVFEDCVTEGFYSLSAYNRVLVLESLMNVALCTQALAGHIDDMADKMIELVKVLLLVVVMLMMMMVMMMMVMMMVMMTMMMMMMTIIVMVAMLTPLRKPT